jgi:hypothetical protein
MSSDAIVYASSQWPLEGQSVRHQIAVRIALANTCSPWSVVMQHPGQLLLPCSMVGQYEPAGKSAEPRSWHRLLSTAPSIAMRRLCPLPCGAITGLDKALAANQYFAP